MKKKIEINHMSKLFVGLLLMVLCMRAEGSDSGFSYSGNVESIDPSTSINIYHPFELGFKLYDKREGGTFLWGKTISLKLDTYGNFTTKLSDSVGSDISGAKFTKLKDALSFAGNEVWLSLKPVDCTETKRTWVTSFFKTENSVVASKIKDYQADYVGANNIKVKNKFTLKDGKVNSLTVKGANILNVNNGLTINNKNCSGSLKFIGKIDGIREYESFNSSVKDIGDVFMLKKHQIPTIDWSYSVMVYPKDENASSIPSEQLIKIYTFGRN